METGPIGQGGQGGQRGPDPLAAGSLTFLLGHAFQAIQTELTDELTRAGYDDLRPLHSMAFQVLQSGGGTSAELGEALGLTKQAAAELVKDLERRGYLYRMPNSAGGRNARYVMTDKAQQHMRIIGYVLARLEGRLVGRIGAEGMGDLRERLAEVIRAQVGDDIPPLRPLW